MLLKHLAQRKLLLRLSSEQDQMRFASHLLRHWPGFRDLQLKYGQMALGGSPSEALRLEEGPGGATAPHQQADPNASRLL